jgi:prepilin-type N-terminal cleavage/methylation domain-containing protein
MKKKMKKTLGFTLIEVLTALTILAIAMLGIIPMVVSTIRANTFGSKMSRATELAQDKLEEIRRMEFNNPDINVGTSPLETIETIYQRQYTVSLVGGNTDIKSISISVDWRDAGRPPQNTTYITTKVRY